MNGPVFKILKGPSPTQTATGQTTTSGMSSIVGALSKAADIVPHDTDGLRQVLHFRLGGARLAKTRASRFWGRFYNKCTGEDPDYIPMSGTHLCQALDAANIAAPDFIEAGGTYALRVDLAEIALANIENTL